MSNTEVGIEIARAILFAIVVHAPLIVQASESSLIPNAGNEQATAGAGNKIITFKSRRMNWFVVPPLGGLETGISDENRLKAGLRTASRPIYASALKGNRTSCGRNP